MIKKLLRVVVFVLALGICVWGLPRIISEVRISEVANLQKIESVFKNINLKTQEPPKIEWTESLILTKINDYRASKKLNVLSTNIKLTNAAKSRLAVISEFADFEGTQTGITREKAIEATGYNFSWIGDLVLVGFYKINDPIVYWLENQNSKNTLENANFREIGIAFKQTNEQVIVYVTLATPQKKVAAIVTPVQEKTTWGGPELWLAVNKSRQEHGVNPLKKEDGLCTIAAIRLNQILEKNKLDNHEGFVPTLQRDDLKWISEKYNVSEFLISGFPTPEEAVKGWLNTLGHAKLLTGGEYNLGCVYAQNTFGVAIAAY